MESLLHINLHNINYQKVGIIEVTNADMKNYKGDQDQQDEIMDKWIS